MPTSRPIQRGEWLTNIRIGSLLFGANIRASAQENPDEYVLQSDFGLELLDGDEYWRTMRERVFGISPDGNMNRAHTNRTAPGLYVREGDTVEPWTSYQAVLLDRRMRALTERHQGLIAQLRLHGAGNIQLRVEDDVVVIRCSGDPMLEGFAAEGVRIEVVDAVHERWFF